METPTKAETSCRYEQLLLLPDPASHIENDGVVSSATDVNIATQRERRAKELWSSTPAAQKARAYLLDKCGLRESTVVRFHMGLVSFRTRVVEPPTRNAICIPLPDSRGPANAPMLWSEAVGGKQKGQYQLIAVPGLTENPKSEQWKQGACLTFYATPATGKDLVVCRRILEAIALSQTLEANTQFTIIASSHIDQWPEEWLASSFWAEWTHVYILHPSEETERQGRDSIGQRLVTLAQRSISLLRPPKCPEGNNINWPECLGSGMTAQQFDQICAGARIIGPRPSVTENLTRITPPGLDDFTEGEFSDLTHDISYSYVHGHYYYPFSILRYTIGSNNEKQITRESRVLRDDGRVLGWTRVPAKHHGHDVLMADDGTLLSRPPMVSDRATWLLDEILAYARGARSGQIADRPLAQILRDAVNLMQSCFWLPQEEDLYLLLFAIPVTYVQEIFSAVPYLLIQGPRGSGKSELANIINSLSANSTILGTGSRAFAAAQLDQARGLIVLDDRENLSAKQLDRDMLELLKIGYKRVTGSRGIVTTNHKLTRQHVYGVKVITCIAGVEEVLGTRMLHINTAPYNRGAANREIQHFGAAEQELANQLRQELHTWTFRNIAKIAAAYEKLPRNESRWAEIVAPLLAISATCGDEALAAGLQAALAKQRQEEVHKSPEDLLSHTMETLVQRGWSEHVTVTHVTNEFGSQLAQRQTTTEVIRPPYEAWVTRTLRAQGWLTGEHPVGRRRVRRRAMQRIWALHPDRVKAVGPQTFPPRDPLAFCQHCNDCSYAAWCRIRRHFQSVPAASARRRRPSCLANDRSDYTNVPSLPAPLHH